MLTTQDDQLLVLDGMKLTQTIKGQGTPSGLDYGYLGKFTTLDQSAFPFVVWANGSGIQLVNLKEGNLSQLVQTKPQLASRGGCCPFMLFTEDYLQTKGEENLVHRPSVHSQTPGEPALDQESMGLSLHYCNINALSDGSHRIGWLVRRYKQDFITTLQKYGSLPAQTTKDVFTLADTVKQKEHELKEMRKTV